MNLNNSGLPPEEPANPHGDRQPSKDAAKDKPAEQPASSATPRELDPLARELAMTTLPSTTQMLMENELYRRHIRYCQVEAFGNGGISNGPRSEIELKVMRKLQANFRAYVQGISSLLDENLPEESILKVPKVGGVYIPRWHIERQGPASLRYYPSQELWRIYNVPDGKKRYCFLARVTNDRGDPIVCFHTFATRHAEERRVLNGSSDISVHRPTTLMRISHTLSNDEEVAYAKSKISSDFTVIPVFSTQSFEFEVRQLRENGARLYLNGHSRPYLANVILHAIASKTGSVNEIDGIHIFTLLPLPQSNAGSFWVDSNRGVFKIWLVHDTSNLDSGRQSWQARFYAEATDEPQPL